MTPLERVDEHWVEVQRLLARHAGRGIAESSGWVMIDLGGVIHYLPTVLASETPPTVPNNAPMLELSWPKHRAWITHLEAVGTYLHSLVVWGVYRGQKLVLEPLPDGFALRPVESADTVDDFRQVQEEAYQESYGHPGGGAWVGPALFDDPAVTGWIIYHEGRPVRTAAIFDVLGIASLGGGACVPEYRGQHLGDALFAAAFTYAFERHAEVIGLTMPQALKLANRIGAVPIGEHRRYLTGGAR